jgi:integrase
MVLRRADGRNVWMVQWKLPGGRTYSRSTGETDRDKAEEAAKALRQEFLLYRDSLRTHPGKSLTFSRAMMLELGALADETSLPQIDRIRYSLLNFLEFCGDVELSRISEDTLEDYQNARLNAVARSTVDKDMYSLLRLLRRNGIRLERPISRRRGRRTEQRAFTREELERFFEACVRRPKYWRPFATMLFTGARPAEILPSPRSNHVALLKTDLDLDAGIVELRSAKRQAGSPTVARRLAIPAGLVEALELQLAEVPGDFVFEGFGRISVVFNRILARAGIRKKDAVGRILTAHCFRHTYATEAAKVVGHNPFALQSALGHADIKTTARYVHPVGQTLSLPFSAICGGVRRGCTVVELGAADED